MLVPGGKSYITAADSSMRYVNEDVVGRAEFRDWPVFNLDIFDSAKNKGRILSIALASELDVECSRLPGPEQSE